MTVKVVCDECGRELVAEDKLLDAIFGDKRRLCGECTRLEDAPKCHYSLVATVTVDGKPLCSEHAGELFEEDEVT